MHHHIARQHRDVLVADVDPFAFGVREVALESAYARNAARDGSLYFVTDCECRAGEAQLAQSDDNA